MVKQIFTGIVEEIGQISEIRSGSNSFRLGVRAHTVLKDVKQGDSIAINGVCLTVVEYSPEQFWADVMPETYHRTTLSNLKAGNHVNLERALRFTDRLGGHLVQGHVDGIGIIASRKRHDIAIIYRIKAPADILRYTVAKGSIAVDGISLTVVEVGPDSFTISLIPHTAHETTLGEKQSGQEVNLESDIIGRYVEKLLLGQAPETGQRNGLNMDFLSRHGFL